MKKLATLLLMSTILFSSCVKVEPPSDGSSSNPSEEPSDGPSDNPTDDPTDNPTDGPTDDPVFNIVELIYSDNLDKDDSANHKDGSYDPYLNKWDGYKNATGSGAASVTYTGPYVVTSSYYTSSAYPGASGVNAFCFLKTNRYVLIDNIKLPENISGNSFLVRLGANISGTFTDNSTIKLSVVSEGTEYAVTYSSKRYGTWNYCTAHFKIQGTIPSDISLKLYSTAAKVRVDDISLALVADEASQTLQFPVKEASEALKTPYFECPEILVPSSSYKQIRHYATTYSSKKQVRNYSACYDIQRHNPLWVAFPMHKIWHEGGLTRPAPDPWRPDPMMAESEQSIIYPERWDEWTYSTDAKWPEGWDTQRWTRLENGAFPGRGHMLASSYRGAGSKSVLFEMNVQTFYPTNVYPEYYKYPKMHGNIEKALYDNWACSDTVYVVVGCWYDDNPVILRDANWGTDTEASKDCQVPAATYRVFLRTKSGNSGKAVNTCTPDELTAIGFWFEQSPRVKNDDEFINQTVTIRDVSVMTVADIEKRIGGSFSFFPDVPAAVKSSYNISDWAGLASFIDTPHSQLP